MLHSPVTARGGRGGRGIGYGSRGGGGGSGGRITGFAQSHSLVDNGAWVVTGGVGGLDEQLVDSDYANVEGPNGTTVVVGNYTMEMAVTDANNVTTWTNVTYYGTLPER